MRLIGAGGVDRAEARDEVPGGHPVWLMRAWSAELLWFHPSAAKFLGGWDLGQACRNLARALR